MEDKRFTHIATDPKFNYNAKHSKKVQIDKRFQDMFKNKQFKVNYKIDSRGRPINRTSTEDLKKYYHLSSEESSSGEELTSDESSPENEDEEEQNEVGKYVKAPKVSDEEPVEVNGDEKHVSDVVKKKLRSLEVDYARGEGKLFSDSSSDEDSESVTSDNEHIEHKWGELDADAERTDEATYRLAACNMDWDRIRAIDLMVLFNSFVPQGGLIKSVAIYPSDFGRERLNEEDIKGPIELVEAKNDVRTDDENEEGSKYHMEKLRQYQLNRLKYYYAVIICDSSNTANKIYMECDGMEYESSATKIDLRFIPDDMSFDEEPKEICDKLPETTKYQPRFFTTSALQQAKVNLTWDETNPERLEITKKLSSGKIDDIDENDIQAYLASSSGEETDEIDDGKSDSESEKNPIDKYRALLSEIEEKEKEKEKNAVQMEVSWETSLKDRTEKLIKSKELDIENKTPFQQYLEKRKEKRKDKREERRKKIESAGDNSDSVEDSDIPSDIDINDPYFAEEFDKDEFKQKKKKTKQTTSDQNIDKQNEAELELLLMNDDNKKHFNLKKIQDQEDASKSKKKRKKNQIEGEVDDFEVNVGDDRFTALYTSHHFNIDPTDSHYRKSKGTEKLINEKLKRRNKEENLEETKKPKPNERKSAELSVLVKSIKRKANAFVNKKS